MKQLKAIGVQYSREADAQRGSALYAGMIVTLMVAGMATAMLTFGAASKNEIEASRGEVRALYLAEAGISETMVAFQASLEPEVDPPEAVGSYDQPQTLYGGNYWVDIVDNGDGTYTATSFGEAGGAQRALEVVIGEVSGGVYANALFAGNSSGDPTYNISLSGSGSQADSITGDVYSRGGIEILDDAYTNGALRAYGSIIGATGEEGVTQPSVDLVAMNYEVNHDFDVAAEFAANEIWRSDNAGGRAWQVPESNPAHIFRKNPTDRLSNVNSTEKNDYFIEDPYEPVNSDSSSDGSNAFPITLSGQDGNSGPDGSDSVYFIDGNLWVHNYRTFSFILAHNPGEEARITFVVKGNVYFSDNIFLEDEETDGVAFIAMMDDDVEDSGNIYFGDPEFGTLEFMNAYMYAENDFYDYNLDAAGSAEVTVVGNMTAGNQVSINRDWEDQHSRLTVVFDDRITNGDFDMPGIPASGSASASGYQVLAWREIAVP